MSCERLRIDTVMCCRVSEMSFVLKSVATLISSLKRSCKEVDRHGYLLLTN